MALRRPPPPLSGRFRLPRRPPVLPWKPDLHRPHSAHARYALRLCAPQIREDQSYPRELTVCSTVCLMRAHPHCA